MSPLQEKQKTKRLAAAVYRRIKANRMTLRHGPEITPSRVLHAIEFLQRLDRGQLWCYYSKQHSVVPTKKLERMLHNESLLFDLHDRIQGLAYEK